MKKHTIPNQDGTIDLYSVDQRGKMHLIFEGLDKDDVNMVWNQYCKFNAYKSHLTDDEESNREYCKIYSL